MRLVLVSIQPVRPKRPEWLRAPAPVGDNYRDLKGLVSRLKLHTVCESAACPNIGDCWNRRTATFMILGNVCTRRCGFCAVQKGVPLEVDYDEPRRVAEAVEAMGLKYAVITSVNRDDRADGGAELFAAVIHAIHERVPGCKVEVLTPDFQGSHAAIDTVLHAAPDCFNHNTETVPRLYKQVRLGFVIGCFHKSSPTRSARCHRSNMNNLTARAPIKLLQILCKMCRFQATRGVRKIKKS